MKLLSKDDLKYKKIVIINNLLNKKPIYQIKNKIKKLHSNSLIIFLKEVDDKILKENMNCKIFSWSIFNNSIKKRCDSHWKSKKYSSNNQIIKSKLMIKFLSGLFKVKKNQLKNAVDKENMILLQEKFELFNINKELAKYNKNITILNNISSITTIFENIRLTLFYLFYPFYSLFFFKIKKNSQNLQIALRAYNSGIKLNNNDIRLDWIVNNKRFKKKSVLFLDDKISDNFKQQINNNNYPSIETQTKKPYYLLNNKHLIKFYPRLFFYIILNFLNFLLLDSYNKKVIINGLKNYILWTNISTLFNLKIYISYHDNSVSSIYRNIILKKNNCKTISYKHSHSELVHDEKNYFSIDFINSYFDKEYHWSKIGILTAKRVLSKSDKLHIILPFCKLLNEKKKKISKKKNFFYVSFFSSQIGTSYAFNNPKEHLLFLKFMLFIIKKNKNVFILFKPKYKIDFLKKNYPEHFIIIKNLIKSNRFSIKKKIKASDMINQSSLSVSMSFSSPTIEALSLMKPSFFVNFQNNFKMNSFRKMQFFYSKNLEESIKNFNFWKNHIIKKKNKKLLNNYFKKIFGNKYYNLEKILEDLSKNLD